MTNTLLAEMSAQDWTLIIGAIGLILTQIAAAVLQYFRDKNTAVKVHAVALRAEQVATDTKDAAEAVKNALVSTEKTTAGKLDKIAAKVEQGTVAVNSAAEAATTAAQSAADTAATAADSATADSPRARRPVHPKHRRAAQHPESRHQAPIVPPKDS